MPRTSSLRQDLDDAGFYPQLVADVLDVALAGEAVTAHLVHPETTFDHELRRHLTVLALTRSRFVVVHVDDVADEESGPGALATSETVALHEIRTVALTHGVLDPAGRGSTSELTLSVGWGAIHRVDLERQSCGDPDCEADHGMTGTLSPEDVVIRVAAQADGQDALDRALRFARELSGATAGQS
ncbi:DUF5998 family protein [Georgenia sp. Z1491]|uniref:DUF5998 family protein n=1 Tax=Georgenia sp. Z1491 TaxID=3416707 RepID=UPI003CF0E739